MIHRFAHGPQFSPNRPARRIAVRLISPETKAMKYAGAGSGLTLNTTVQPGDGTPI